MELSYEAGIRLDTIQQTQETHTALLVMLCEKMGIDLKKEQEKAKN